MAVKDYNVDPDLNTTISGINIAEGCAPSGINNAIRQLMADVKDASEEQTSKDAEQDAAISAAQSGAEEAKTTANAAVKKVEDATPDATGNVTLDNVVHLSGDETITGAKTFIDQLEMKKDNSYFRLKSATFAKGATGANAVIGNILFCSNDGSNTIAAQGLGRLACSYLDDDKVVKTSLYSYRNIAANTGSATFSLCMPSSGFGWAEVGSEKVVTLVSSASATAKWYRKFSDGHIIQGGTFTADATTHATAMALAYANKDTYVAFAVAENAYIPFCATTQTTTTAKFSTTAGTTYRWIAIGI